MELLIAIAGLCQLSNWTPSYQLQCQQYYIECVDRTKIETPLLNNEEKEKIALKVCVKSARIGINGDMF